MSAKEFHGKWKCVSSSKFDQFLVLTGMDQEEAEIYEV